MPTAKPVILTTPPPAGVRLLDHKQARERIRQSLGLSVSRAQFYRMLHRGDFPEAYRLYARNGVCVPEWAVDAYVRGILIGRRITEDAA